MIDQAPAAVRLDNVGDASGDGPGATNGVVATIQVTGHDERMDRERTL